MSHPRLDVTDGSGHRRVVPIDKPLFSIGRRAGCDLHVESADVSREDAEIVCEGGQCRIRDCSSRFGTFVNDERVVERLLVHGDRIRLGVNDAVELLFLLDRTDSTITDAGSGVVNLRQIAALLDGLRALGSGKVLDEVLTLVMDLALDVTDAERGFIMLADARGELEFKIARGKGRITLPGKTFATSFKIPREVFSTGESRLVGNLLDPSLAEDHKGTVALGIRHVLCVPLGVVPYGTGGSSAVQAKLIGVLYLDGQEKRTLHAQATQTALETFATQAALAIESARLYSEAAENARLERDLRIAADIQRALLPAPSYRGAGFDIAAVSLPSRTIGGDFFDYLELPDGAVGFALGDVAGKGLPAALLAVALQSIFAAQAPVAGGPAETMVRINRTFWQRAIEARFATMFYGVLSPQGGLSYCCAGHEPPLLVSGSDVQRLETGGTVLGLFEGPVYEPGVVQLEAGDVIIVYSDGVTDAPNASDEEFGRNRLIACASTNRHLEPEALLERLLEALRVFTAGAPQADDITVLVLRYRGL